MPSYLEIIESGNFTEIKSIFTSNKPKPEYLQNELNWLDKLLGEFNVHNHDVMKDEPGKRPNKKAFIPNINQNTGEVEVDSSTGNPKVTPKSIPVNRVPVPFQEIIVNRRVAFMLANPVSYQVTNNIDENATKELTEMVQTIEDDNKYYYKAMELARRSWSELESAELWYLREKNETDVKDFDLRLKILSPKLGDTLYPLFDDYGDMVAFAREYKTKESSETIERFDIYTEAFTYKYANRGEWKLDQMAPSKGKIKNPIEKIPVIYYPEERPEWAKVQPMIGRLEKLLSNHSDMNDYFGEPILAIFGDLIQAINKGDSGKILKMAENAKASFLALDSPPESIKMEIENLEKFIYAMSQTPNIAFSEMKNLGDLSGVALELMFLDAHLAIKAKEETFGLGYQRHVNLIKAYIGELLNTKLKGTAKKVNLKPVFTPYMPSNLKEIVEMIAVSYTSGYLSKKSAATQLKKIGFIDDVDGELKELAKDKKENSIIGNPDLNVN